MHSQCRCCAYCGNGSATAYPAAPYATPSEAISPVTARQHRPYRQLRSRPVPPQPVSVPFPRRGFQALPPQTGNRTPQQLSPAHGGQHVWHRAERGMPHPRIPQMSVSGCEGRMYRKQPRPCRSHQPLSPARVPGRAHSGPVRYRLHLPATAARSTLLHHPPSAARAWDSRSWPLQYGAHRHRAGA